MRLDTAGVERNPPLPTINFDTLFAAAILIMMMRMMMMMMMVVVVMIMKATVMI